MLTESKKLYVQELLTKKAKKDVKKLTDEFFKTVDAIVAEESAKYETILKNFMDASKALNKNIQVKLDMKELNNVLDTLLEDYRGLVYNAAENCEFKATAEIMKQIEDIRRDYYPQSGNAYSTKALEIFIDAESKTKTSDLKRLVKNSEADKE